MPGKWSDAEVATLERLAGDGLTDREIADAMPGRSRKAIEQARSRYDIAAGISQGRASQPGRRTLEDAVRELAGEDVPEYPTVSLTTEDMARIETLDDLVRKFGADPDEWHIQRMYPRGSSWDMQLKGGELGQGHAYRISGELVRKPTLELQEQEARILEMVEAHSPMYPKWEQPEPTDDPHLLEFSPFDLHMGKLAWAPETGSHYDTSIASHLLTEATEDIIRKVSGFPVRQVLIPLGHDLFNADNPEGTTASGTPQDMDSRSEKVKDRTEALMVHVIDRLATIAPVKVITVPGNHDRDAAQWMGRVLRAWYRNTDRVDVDCGPRLRKYHRHGIALLGFTHGNEEKHRDLPLIMARECGNDWAECEQFEFHTGHYHSARQTVYNAGDSFNGVRVRILPSLSSADAWHASKGYVKSWRAVESYLWSERTGYVGHFSSNVTTAGNVQRIAA